MSYMVFQLAYDFSAHCVIDHWSVSLHSCGDRVAATMRARKPANYVSVFCEYILTEWRTGLVHEDPCGSMGSVHIQENIVHSA